MTQDDSILKESIQVHITKTEHGFAVPIPEETLLSAGFKEGDVVNIYVRKGCLEVTDPSERRYDTEKMVAQITDENLPDYIDSGPPVGREIW